MDLTQIDNYFHMVRFVNKFGILKTKFLSLEEKRLFSANGQWDCLQRSLVSLYPNSGFVNPSDIIQILKEKHENVEEVVECDIMEVDENLIPSIDQMDAPF